MKTNPTFNSYPQFQSSTSRCGQTGYGLNDHTRLFVIASEIYDTCIEHDNVTMFANPNRPFVALHEVGHAFDFALAATNNNQNTAPSTSVAFQNLANDSTNTPSAASDFYSIVNGSGGRAKPQTCTVFGSVTPSQLELDLGYPGAVNGPVCTNNVVNSQFKGLTNLQIAQKQDRYFVNPSTLLYSELWAQEFAITTLNTDHPTLSQLDAEFHSGYYPCTRAALEAFYTTVAPPLWRISQRRVAPFRQEVIGVNKS